ncbi:MAG TPA: hypothetical protein PK978_03010 [Paludibacter sp.]|nr:hypothetical protein [Paludibacter sp.]HOS45212.1 hypothetical protein [Paludibacter sp.]HPM09016.1 hypothetical protein [Paludibacter sp.]
MYKYGFTEKQALRSKLWTGKLLYSATELGISGQIPSGQSTYTESGASLDNKGINSISIEQEREEFFASLPRVEKHISNLEKKLQKEEAKLEENPLDIAQNKAVLELKAEMEAYSNYVNQVKEQPVETIESEQEIEKQAVLSSEIQPVGEGAFGKIYDQFKGKPNEAIKFLIEQQSGEAIGALHHPDIGDIDLVWGKEGSGKSDGYGLSKIVKYHPEVVEKLQDILSEMEVVKRTKNRVNLESEKYQAVVRLEWDNVRKNWLLTAFEKRNIVSDSRTDIVTEPTEAGKQNDTATLQNDTSDNKGNTEVFENQEKDEKFLSTSQPTETIEQPIEQTQTKTPEQSEAELANKEAYQARRKALLDEVDRLSELFNTPVIIHESIEAEVHPDYIKKDGVRSAENGYNDQMLIHRFYGAVEIDGQMYRVKTTINEYKDESRTATPYSYEVIKIELLEESNSPTELNSPNSEIGGLSIETAKFLKGIEKSYDKGKYLLDESENDTPLFRFIGERGASHLENANKVLDELRVAREMETTTKDAKTIRLVTGWKRGADGKWRFEQPDEKIVNIAALAKNLKSTLDELIGVELIQTYPELADIKSKAVKDSTFMKAPNGNPTNLNERQWLQVRTPEFKEWFGDTTENDPTLLYYNRYIPTPPSNIP